MNTMKRILLIITLIIIIPIFSSCQYFSRKLGGTSEIKVDNVNDIINVTWKGHNIWVLNKPNDSTMIMQEYSPLGILEGKIIIKKK